MARRARELGEQAQDTASAARTYASEQFDRVSSAIAGGTDQVRGLADAAGAAVASNSQRIKDSAASAGATLSDRASGLKDDGRRLAGSAATTVQDIADGATAAARSAASTVVDTGVDAARTVRRTASDASDQAGKTIFQTIEQNPLLVAGVGLLVGGLIASALPRSGSRMTCWRRQPRGEKRARRRISWLRCCKATVGEVYDETARQAEAEGLTPDGMVRPHKHQPARPSGRRGCGDDSFEPSEQDHQPSLTERTTMADQTFKTGSNWTRLSQASRNATTRRN